MLQGNLEAVLKEVAFMDIGLATWPSTEASSEGEGSLSSCLHPCHASCKHQHLAPPHQRRQCNARNM